MHPRYDSFHKRLGNCFSLPVNILCTNSSQAQKKYNLCISIYWACWADIALDMLTKLYKFDKIRNQTKKNYPPVKCILSSSVIYFQNTKKVFYELIDK